MKYLRVDISDSIYENDTASDFSRVFQPILSDLDKLYFIAQEFSFNVNADKISDYFKERGIDDEVEKYCFYYNDDISCGSYLPGFIKKHCTLLSDLDPTLIFFKNKDDNAEMEKIFDLRYKGAESFIKSFGKAKCLINNEDGTYWELIDRDGRYIDRVVEYLDSKKNYQYDLLPLEESFFVKIT